MATFDAIAYLGDTMRTILQTGLMDLGLVSAPGDVLLATPNELKKFAPKDPSVTIFLYHVGVCGEMRNAPRRLSGGGGLQRPPLPLELRYLLTPWTQSVRDGHRIIGAIAQILHDRAVLAYGELEGDEVWEPDDTVELMLESVPVEEHYDIWDPTDIPYRLSLTYLARIIGIDSAAAGGAPPVAVAAFPGTAA